MLHHVSPAQMIPEDGGQTDENDVCHVAGTGTVQYTRPVSSSFFRFHMLT